MYFLGNDIKYLDEQVFRPFFDANQRNRILINKHYFHVNHNENRWNQSCKYYKQIINFKRINIFQLINMKNTIKYY